LRKPAGAKGAPDFAKSITADDVFAHLIAKIDAADAANGKPSDPEQPGVSPPVRN
jgi:hypothetical protein